MDPVTAIGVASGVVSLVGATLQAAQQLHVVINSLRHAPDEIRTLHDEVNRTAEILLELCSICHPRSSTLGVLPRTVERAWETIHALDAYLKQLIRSQGPSKTEVDRIAWIRHKKKAGALLVDLKDLRADIGLLLGASTSSSISRIELAVTQSLRQRHSISTQIEEVAQKQGEHQQRNLEMLRKISAAVNSNPASLPQSVLRAHSDAEKGLALANNHARFQVQRFSTSARLCVVGCSCICHKRQHLKSPEPLEALMGSLIMSYTGHPVRARKCNESSCGANSPFSAQFTYNFPQWLLMWAISIMIVKTSLGFGFYPKLNNLVPENAKVFSLILTGDLAGVQSLFKRRLASPTDIRGGSRVTPLSYAIYTRNIHLCKFLLDEGSDPYYEDGTGGSATSRAWSAILAKHHQDDVLDQLRLLFPDKDCLIEKQLPVLHKIVLGLVNKDLEKELLVSSAGINCVDADGLTALAWAAQRGDCQAVELLLRHGADPEICSKTKRTALNWAVEALCLKCIELLVDAGADVNHVDQWGLCPLHDAFWSEDDPKYIKPLLSKGADINLKAKSGRCALTYAAARDSVITVDFLIRNGADLESRDNQGYSALLTAVLNHCDKVLELLLHCGADITVADKKMNTMLHIIADRGRLSTLDVLTKANLRGLDPEARNIEGFRAWDLFCRCGEQVEDGFAQGLEALLEKLSRQDRAAIVEIYDDTSENEEECFVDAEMVLPEKNSSGLDKLEDVKSPLPDCFVSISELCELAV